MTEPMHDHHAIDYVEFTVRDLAGAGVRRISLATSLYRAAMTAAIAAAREVHEHGTFAYLDDSIPTPEFNRFMR